MILGFAINGEALPQASPQEVEAFRLKSAAHRLRVATALQHLLQNEKFLSQNPEYRILADNMDAVMATTLNHDYFKNGLRKDHPVIQTLAKNYGSDFRSLSSKDPQRVQLERQIAELNRRDDVHWQSSMKKRIPSPIARTLLSDLVTTLDFHDVAESRKSEFGVGTTQMKRQFWPVSEWVRRKYTELGLDTYQLGRISRAASYLESEVDYQKITGHINERYVGKHGFGKIARELRATSKVAKPTAPQTRSSEIVVKSPETPHIEPEVKKRSWSFFARRVPVIGKVTAALAGLTTHANISAEKVTTGITTTSALSDCQTVGCNQLKNLCAEKRLSERDCIEKEFIERFSLSEQTKKRQDPDLNRWVQRYYGQVADVQCPEQLGPSQYMIEFRQDDDFVKYMVNTGPNNEIERIHSDGKKMFFANGKPDVMYIDIEQRQIMLQEKEWRNMGYFEATVHPERYTQVKKAKEALGQITRQLDQLKACCGDKSCTNHFTRLQAERRWTGAKSRSAQTAP